MTRVRLHRPLLDRLVNNLHVGLVGYWRLDEASGVALDASGNGNALTDNNTVTSAAGKIVTARQFTAATSEYLSIADNAALSMGNIDFTIAGWVFLDSKPADTMWVADKWSAVGNQREYALTWNQATDRFRLTVSADGTASAFVDANTFGAPSTATWYFLLAAHDARGDLIRISVNGGAFDSAAHATGVFDGTSQFFLGSHPGLTQFWDGRIDEVGVWKRLLTSKELAYLYNAGVGRAFPFRGAL